MLLHFHDPTMFYKTEILTRISGIKQMYFANSLIGVSNVRRLEFPLVGGKRMPFSFAAKDASYWFSKGLI